MAKVTGPLLSLTARGSLGEELTYSKRSSGQQVRFQKKQKGTASVDQQTERDMFFEARDHWQQLTTEEKELWKTWNG